MLRNLKVCRCGGPAMPKIVGRRDGAKMKGRTKRYMRFVTTYHECIRCGARLHTAKIYDVPAASAQLPTHSYILTAHHDYDVFVHGVYLTTQEAYLWCEQAADDALWHIREAVRAAEHDQERIDAEYARMIAAFSHPATAQALALRIRDEDDLEFEVAA